jgi:hypothetical protein
MNNNLSKRKGKNNTKAKNGEELPEKKEKSLQSEERGHATGTRQTAAHCP